MPEINYDMEELFPYFKGKNSNLRLMNTRMGNLDLPRYKPDTVQGEIDMAKRLEAKGGFPQQDRMIRDKRRSLDKATLYSYQGAKVKKQLYDFKPVMDGVREADPVRALINPNKLKMDYDDKIISIGFEHGFHVGDVFEWCNTGTYWIIYLQDLEELAYFRGDIRKCSYEIEWDDEDGKRQRTYVALRGPVETKIDYIQKHGISVDNPNYSLNILMPKTTANLKQFKRYNKFYLQDLVEGEDRVCWRVEAIDTFSTPGIIEVTAVEYYANEFEDDVEAGKVGSLIKKPIDPNVGTDSEFIIVGDTFIKPKKEYIYYIKGSQYGQWYISDAKLPIKKEEFEDDMGRSAIRIKWDSSYSGLFDLWYGDENGPMFDYKKTIVVESLF